MEIFLKVLSHFAPAVGDQDKNWAPHQICRTCVENLRQWTKRKKLLGLQFL